MDNTTLGILLFCLCSITPLTLGVVIGMAFKPRWDKYKMRAFIPMGTIEKIRQGWENIGD